MQSFRDQEDSVISGGVVSQPYKESVRDAFVSSWSLPSSCGVVQGIVLVNERREGCS